MPGLIAEHLLERSSEACTRIVELLLVRYIGWYSNRARGERAKRHNERDALDPGAARPEPMSEFASRAKAAWARLIRKVYEVDPLECPKCNGPMRIIALIDDPRVIRRILEHLGL
jgi:hypothetical protein